LGILSLLIGHSFVAFHQWLIKRRAAREPPLLACVLWIGHFIFID
jgi:hypothetical protein